MRNSICLLMVLFSFCFQNVQGQSENENRKEFNVQAQWRKDLDSALYNTMSHMTANFEQYKVDANKLSVEQMKTLLIRQQDLDRLSRNVSYCIKILEVEKRFFNEKEQKALKGIQGRLTLWATEGLHPYLDKLSYLTLQEINVFIKTFEVDGYLKF